MEELQQEDIQTLNEWAGFLSYKPCFLLESILKTDAGTVLLDTGNQCIEANEYVYTSTGPIQVKNVSCGDTIYGGRILSKNSFEDDAYLVRFQTGIKIIVNGEHLFWWKQKKTAKKELWKRVKDIVPVKQYKYGSVYFPTIQDDGINIKEAKLFGYLSSDGYLAVSNGQTIKFTNTNKEFLDEVELLATSLFDVAVNKREKGNGWDYHIVHKKDKQNPLRSYLLSFGLTNDSIGSMVCGNKDSLREFISGFFNGDGYLLIRKRKTGYGTLPSPEIGFCIGVSNKKALEIQYILWKLGVYSHISKETMKKSTVPFYRIKVNTISTEKLIGILDHSKYPEKFKEALSILKRNPYPRINGQNWFQISSIKPIGKRTFVGIKTESETFLSYCGMLNHNTGKNDAIAQHYVIRLLGQHPIESKNMRPDTQIRTLRFAAQTLPMEPDGQGEVRNTVYPAFKRRLPPGMIKKDVTVRKPIMILRDPQGGPDIVIEFVSYGQQIQSQAGVQRWSIYLDEQAPFDFYQEQLPRLLAARGDLIIGLTPLEGVTWIYEEIFEKARTVYNSPTVIDYMKAVHKEVINPIERFDKPHNIAVIRASTDDNPTFTKDQVDEIMSRYDNEADYEVRRYGIFHQISGVIFKDFDARMNSRTQFGHVVSRNEYFAEGLPHEWVHARGVDFHTHVNWACIWATISRDNECFIYNEYNPSPDRQVTHEITRQIADRSGDYKFVLNLIDPVAASTQVNTGLSPLDDINRQFGEYRRNGLCTGGFWQTWDTKNEKGRDAVKERLKNARLCGRPFNNRVVGKDGRETHLPTLWVLDNCQQTIYSFRNWRWQQWADRNSLQTKDEKNKPEDRHSHFPITIECLFKHPAFSVGHYKSFVPHRTTGYETAMRARA